MAIVQHASNQGVFSSGTTGSVTVPISAASAGNALVACIGITSASAAPTVASVKTGTNAENWAKAVGISDAAFGIDSEQWVDLNTAGGGTSVVVVANFAQTATATKQTVVQVDVFEVSGVPASAAVDVVSASPGNSDTASWSSGTTATTAQASEIAFGHSLVLPDSGGTGTVTLPGSPWTNETTLHDSGSVGGFGTFNMYSTAGFNTLSSTGTVVYNGTSSSTSFWVATVMTLKLNTSVTTSGGMTLRPGLSGSAGGGSVSASGGMTLKPSLAGTGIIPIPVTTSGGMTFRPSLAGSARVPTVASGGLTFRPALFGTDIENFIGAGGLTFRPSLAGSASYVPTFPENPLAFIVELNLNGTWTDITDYVYERDPINITDIGRPNESSTIQAGQCTLTLNNRDGRFTPKNAAGAYYPYIQRNTQIRVHVNAASVTGVNYSGYRFFGEVSEWPPTADTTGTDQYLQITSSGIWRRLSRANTNIGSAYTRYNRTLSNVAGYWTMEDGSGSLDFASGILGQSVMAFTSGAPNLSSSGAFLGSDALPALNGSVLTGSIATASNPTVNRFRFAMFVPSGGDTGVPSGSVLATLHTSGTVARVDVTLTGSGGGPVTIKGYNSGGSQLFSADSTTVHTFGITLLAEVSLVQSGGNISYALNLYLPGDTSPTASASGSITGTVDDATSVVFNSGAAYKGTVVGQAIVLYSSPALADAADAIGGHVGEAAIARFERICTEEGIPFEVIGSSSVQMGPQFNGTISAVLQTIEDSDQGLLYESITQFGLGYRAYNSMVDQTAVATLDYAAGMLSAVPVPTYDDQNIVNDVTVKNYDGYTYRLQLASGAMSVQDPPNGVGDYPGNPVDVNLYSVGEATGIAQVAKRILNPGVVDEIRIPSVSVNLARSQVASLFATIPGVFVGDYLAISNPPSWLSGASPSKQIVLGYSETLSNFGWYIVFNTIPEVGYESAFFPGTTSGSRSAGNTVTGSQSGSVSGAEIGDGAISPGNLSDYTNSASIGGVTVSEGPTAPVDPNTGDLWINSSAGYQINRFDGTNWNGIVFDATNVIAAGTITASEILVGTLTASLFAAGIVVAGIVDATTISGAQLILHGSTGQVLVYSGSPASGNMVASLSGATGADGRGNSYGSGFAIYGSNGSQVHMYVNGSQAVTEYPSGGGTEATPTRMSMTIFNQGAGNERMEMRFAGPQSTFDNLGVNVILDGTAADGSFTCTGFLEVGGSSSAAWGPGVLGTYLAVTHQLLVGGATGSAAVEVNGGANFGGNVIVAGGLNGSGALPLSTVSSPSLTSPSANEVSLAGAINGLINRMHSLGFIL